jgi:transposase
MNENTINEIVRLWRGGSSRRRIARQLGISRYQVDQVIRAHEGGRREGTTAAGLPRAKRQRASCLDDYEASLRQLWERYPEITAVRAHEELQKLGFRGGYNVVKRRLRQLRPARKAEFVRRFETGPGAQAQMDYGTYTIPFAQEGPRRVHLFSYVLGYSRRQYLRFVEAQDFTTTIREHVRAFEYFGGCAATCLYDNLKVVVTRYEGDEPIYNTRFLAFATHYGYRPWACRPYRPRTKGKVERPFHYVETNLLNGRTFQSLEHLNDVTRWWLEHVADVRMHRETKQRPLDRYQEERAHLIPLPAQAYDTAEVVYRCVSGEGLIVYCQNRYSVPWRYLGLMVPVRVTEDEVVIYGPQIEEIARHPLLPRQLTGKTSCRAEHQPGDDGEKKYELLKQRYAELGEVASRFFDGLIRRRRYGKDEAQKILALLETYARRDLLAAIERAVRYGAYTRSAIERILAVSATPRPALDKLAEQESQQLKSLLGERPVQPRSSKEYGELFRPEPSEPTHDEATSNTSPPEPHESQPGSASENPGAPEDLGGLPG